MEPVSSSPDLSRKLVAILAADVVGFTAHMERDELATLEVLTSYRTIFDDVINSKNGRVTGTAGDSVIAEFGSVIDAVLCAVEVQERLHVENQSHPEKNRLIFRIGINVGDVVEKDGDIFGDGVNVAARLETLSDPGGVCISRGVFDYVSKQTSFVYEDRGEQNVKNIAEPIRAYCVRFEDGIAERNEDAFVSVESVEMALDDTPQNAALEITFWESVKDTNSADELQAYLDQYPDGTFWQLANLRMAELTGTGEDE